MYIDWIEERISKGIPLFIDTLESPDLTPIEQLLFYNNVGALFFSSLPKVATITEAVNLNYYD